MIAPGEQGCVQRAQGVPGAAAADRDQRIRVLAAHGRAVAQIGQPIHPILGQPAHIIHIDRAGEEERIGGVHFGAEEGDVIFERTGIFPAIKTRATAPARADVQVAQKERLEVQRHGVLCR